MKTSARGILLDIEGTTSSISFVYDVMFPYVREHLKDFLNADWDSDELNSCLDVLAADLGKPPIEQWLGGQPDSQKQQEIYEGVIGLMDADVKATGLKQLQGLIWADGFHGGQLVAHLFDDVAEAINQWKSQGKDVRIYSSGSIAAQKLFFGHTVAGDLLDCFNGHYDTTTGSKKDATSYEAIAGEFGLAANEILFVSDVVDELVAAKTAGMQTLLSVRPGNKPVELSHGFESVESFAAIEIV